MENFKKVARWHENPLFGAKDRARQAEHEKQVAAQGKDRVGNPSRE